MSIQKDLPTNEVRNSMAAVLDELAKDVEVMDTHLIDELLADNASPQQEVAALLAKRIEREYAQAQRRIRRRKIFKRIGAAAACLAIGVFSFWGAAQAFHWEEFLRLFENLSEVLSLNVKAPEYPAQVLPSEGSVEDGQVMQAAAEAPEAVLGRLEEPWRTALKQLHQRWPIQSVNVYQDETIDIYNFKLAIHEGRSSYVEVRLNKPGGTFGNIGAEITEGSEEKLIIGEEIVTLYMNIDYWGGYASNEQSYVRVWKNNSKEEVISIFEILIGGTSHAED